MSKQYDEELSMHGILRPWTLVLLVLAGAGGCGDEGDDAKITGPGLDTGPGRAYPIKEISFPANDGVEVSALFGPASRAEPGPVLLLLHDLSGSKETWLSNTFLFVELLERGYMVVAIDLRGYGQTPLPGDRQVPLVEDLESSFLDVHAALTWLQDQPGADMDRIALIGEGSGGNIAYVSMGIFPQQIKTAVSLSPGLWERSTLQPVVVGAGLDPFGPRSILFMVGEDDVISGGDITLSYVEFARLLAATTEEPKSLLVFRNSDDHGLSLLNNIPEALDSIFLWLEENL